MTCNSIRIALMAVLTLLCGACSLSGQSSKIVGDWFYRDGGGNLEYTFSSDGTYSAIKELTAPGYPRLVIRTKGNYQVRGANVALEPTESTANLVRETGRYDAGRDKLILRKENSDSDIVYSRK